MKDEESKQILNVEQKSFIKLSKNAKGDKVWEIKVVSDNHNWALKEAKKIDADLEKEYGT